MSSDDSPSVRVTLPDGRTLDMRPISGNDLIALAGDDLTVMLSRLKGAITAQSWDGDLLDLPWPMLRGILRDWRKATEEAALPPDDGAS